MSPQCMVHMHNNNFIIFNTNTSWISCKNDFKSRNTPTYVYVILHSVESSVKQWQWQLGHYDVLGCCSASATYIFPRPCPEVFSSCWQKASSCSRKSKLSSRFGGCGWRILSSFSTASSGSGRRGSPLVRRFWFSSLCWYNRIQYSTVGLTTCY